MARTRRKRPSGESIAAPAKISVTLTVNGVARELAVAPWVTLLDALRDRLGLTGTKKAATTASAAAVRCWSTAGASIPA